MLTIARFRRVSTMLLFAYLPTQSLEMRAQTPDAVGKVVATITPAKLADQIAMLTADSLQVRTTPSAAIDRIAQYLAETFNGSMDAYPVPGRQVQLLDTASVISFYYALRWRDRPMVGEDGGSVKKWLPVFFTNAARFLVPRVPDAMSNKPPVVLLTGRPTTAFLRQAGLANKAVLYVPPADLDTLERRSIVDELYRSSRSAVLLSEEDSSYFASQRATQPRQPLQLADAYLEEDSPSPWVVEVRASAIAELLTGLGIDLAQARTSHAPVLRELPQLRTELSVQIDRTSASSVSAPNVLLRVDGDSMFKDECLVVTAPLDQRQPVSSGTGNASAGADPSTVSLAGLLELVRAFRTPPVQPRRTIIFLAASGGAPGQTFWGSQYYQYRRNFLDCTIVLSLAIDLGVGGPMPRDTAVFGGMDEVNLGTPITWVTSMHPELGLTVADGGTATLPRSDAFPFIRRGHPSLVVQGGTTDIAVGLPSQKVSDLEQAARLLRLVFYSVYSIANDPVRPTWNAVGRRRMFERP